MSERERYPGGVPCWVETLQPDPQAALAFYGPLFGWEFADPGPMPGNPPGQYFVAQVRGRDVAGIGSLPEPSEWQPTVWSTYVRVESADEAAERARDGGGRVLAGPLDVPPAGRLAVAADPAGASFGVWEAGSREGAQVINESRAWSMSMLHTSEPEKAATFYEAMFGWKAEPFGPPEARLSVWRLPGYVGGEPQQPVPRDVVAVLAGDGGKGSPGTGSPHWSVDFWVDDTDLTAAHAEGLGGSVVVAPHDTPRFRSAAIADPQGAIFSINARTA
jgi:predicted enzyme related to lactoylglutathione lyase